MTDAIKAGHRVLLPEGWPKPSGYSNGIVADGQTIFLGGQIGWDAQGKFAEGLAAQVGQAMANIVDVLTVAGTPPTSIVRLTWFVDGWLEKLL